MTDRRYLLRAVYDHTRDSFVVDELRRANGEPYVEYRLVMLDGAGGLEKRWWNERGEPASEFFAFGTFENAAVFEDTCRTLLAQARENAEVENLDLFLALIDLVKHLAVQAGMAGAALLDDEGLFESGFDDAYTLREMPHHRLHQRVIRPQQECWTLRVCSVCDSIGGVQGWAVVALHFPTLDANASAQQMANAPSARALDLDHFQGELDARMACGFIERFMAAGDRVHDPDYATLNDTTVFEIISVMCRAENDYTPPWFELRDDTLRQCIDGTLMLTRDADQWFARHTDMLTDFLQAMPQPPGMEDQLRAALMDIHGVADDFDQSSPWHEFDVDFDHFDRDEEA